MFRKKTHFILILCLILLLSVVSIAQAAPPWQEDSQDNTSLRETLDPDEDEDVDDDEDDDGPGDKAKLHPVADRLAEHFGKSHEEIKALHDSGYGFGAIAKAYFFADKLKMSATNELLPQAQKIGWGKLLKQNGIHPGSLGPPGQIKKDELSGQAKGGPPGGDGPPGQVKKDELSGQAKGGPPGGDGPPGQVKKDELSGQAKGGPPGGDGPPGQVKKGNNTSGQ